MRIEMELPTVEPDDFARRFQMRAGRLMWLLGAGASVSAGIPTAWDMVWEFKQQLFISQRRVAIGRVSDLSNPAIRQLLQGHIDASGKFPTAGSADEYAALFEAAWPNETDRQTYLDSKLKGAKPSYGHIALASLMKGGYLKLVWTTNFDPLIADASAKVHDSTGALTSVALDAPDLAAQSIASERWPVEVKLHGDFRSRRLKNTNDELREQDAILRRSLVEASQKFGLVVVGYSGRDSSVMATLDKALQADGAFPAGLFWLHKGDNNPLEGVVELLRRAKSKGIDGGVVRVISFDETMRDLLRLYQGLDTTVLDELSAERRRWTAAPPQGGRKGWPVIRLNALEMVEIPTHCRLIDCKIGGTGAVREALASANANAIAARTRAGVLAFGPDSELRNAFGGFGVNSFDLHAIETRRLRIDSGERGLLREAISLAISRSFDMTVTRRRGGDLLAPAFPDNEKWQELRDLVGSNTGTLAGDPSLRWREGVAMRLDWADDRLWLLIEPRIVFDGLTDANRFLATDFARERTVRRYNIPLNALIGYWCDLLANGGTELRSFNVGDGVDAVFRLGADTAYSRRITA